MIFDKQNLVKDNGADDWADSARLAGLMALFQHPEAPRCAKYIIKDRKPVRHPTQDKYPENEPRCMSRDQLVCLMAGLWRQQSAFAAIMDGFWFAPNDMDEKTGKWKVPDIFMPSVRAHFSACAYKPFSWIGLQFLKLDIWYASVAVSEAFLRYDAWLKKIKSADEKRPDDTYPPEQNQLMALCELAGPEMKKRYKDRVDWKRCVRDYWAVSYRNEYEWAEYIIQYWEKT